MIQSPPSKTQLTRTTRRPTKVRIEEARAAAKAAGALDLPLVVSYLTLCSDAEDMRRSLIQLRQNRPSLFRRGRREKR